MKLIAKEVVNQINLVETHFSEKTDIQLKEYSRSLAEKIKQNISMDQLIIESFALVRETSKRVLGLRPYDTQLLGGIYLHQGKIAEMKTGEGKTLAASLPSYLNGLSKKGVHVITVNNYLARRDYDSIGQIFRFLNLKVGLLQENESMQTKKFSYSSDIMYGTSSEIAFDYLRDCLAQNPVDVIQRQFNYCIIDEVDSILIDEARTPLILSQAIPKKSESEKMKLINSIVKLLESKDYEINEKEKNVLLTEFGKLKFEDLLETTDLYNFKNPWIFYINNALLAHFIFFKNSDYIIINNEICIVDEYTGRVLEGRKWSDGLHQAVEIKENLEPSSNSETSMSITYQNFFKLYNKLSGMTGTAKTEEPEFQTIYNLSVEVVPTYKKTIREDLPDLVLFSQYEKWNFIRNKCDLYYKQGIPLLVGTATVEKSELLSNLLIEAKVPHQLLNARPENLTRESQIVARAGEKSRVTIATNMAGRGTDIILGGNLFYFLNRSSFKYFEKFSEIKLETFSFHSKKERNLTKLNLVKLKTKNIYSIFKKLKNEKHEIYKKIYGIITNFEQQTQRTNILLKIKTKLFKTTELELKKFFQEKGGRNYLYSCLKISYLYQFSFYNLVISFNRNQIQKKGGLAVLGTERQDSRRIDNQLRGRCGRQGDNGTTQFILSLDDRLIKLFTDNRLKKTFSELNVILEEPLQSSLITTTLNRAQEKLESLNFTARKQLFEFDEIIEIQRCIFLFNREKILRSSNFTKFILESCEKILDDLAIVLILLKTNKKKLIDEFDINGKLFLLNLLMRKNKSLKEKLSSLDSLKDIRKILYKEFWAQFDILKDEKHESTSEILEQEDYSRSKKLIVIRKLEREILLSSIDKAWRDHLEKTKNLRDSTAWRVFAQKKHIREYKIDASKLFKEMAYNIYYNIFVSILAYEDLNNNFI